MGKSQVSHRTPNPACDYNSTLGLKTSKESVIISLKNVIGI
jgi:hypothetical protein